MDARTQSHIAQLYRQYRRSEEASEKRKLVAALTECLTGYFAAQERVLRAERTLSLCRFREHYLAARAFSELRTLDVGSALFDAKLATLCVRLGALRAVDGEPDVLRAA
jgi:hypothetical protein